MYIDQLRAQQQLGNNDLGGKLDVQADADDLGLAHIDPTHRNHEKYTQWLTDKGR